MKTKPTQKQKRAAAAVEKALDMAFDCGLQLNVTQDYGIRLIFDHPIPFTEAEKAADQERVVKSGYSLDPECEESEDKWMKRASIQICPDAMHIKHFHGAY